MRSTYWAHGNLSQIIDMWKNPTSFGTVTNLFPRAIKNVSLAGFELSRNTVALTTKSLQA